MDEGEEDEEQENVVERREKDERAEEKGSKTGRRWRMVMESWWMRR